jgi:hypothetical protein
MKQVTILILTLYLVGCGTLGGAVYGAGDDLHKAGEWIKAK